MSKTAIAAFLKQVSEDANLQQALVEFAARRGFRFSPRDLREVDLLNLSAAEPTDAPDEPDDDSLDPGFGMGEYPA